MFKYMKTLNYPINIKRKDLKMAKYLYTQLGGANSELAAALRYFIRLLLFYDSCPSVFVFFFAPLDSCQVVIQFLGQITDLEVIDGDFFSLVNQCSYR